MRFLKLFLWCSLPCTSLAQKNVSALGSWNIVSARYALTDRIGLFGEAQLRSLHFYDHFFYYEAKGGISYRVDDHLSVALGFGKYNTYREGGDFVKPLQNDELRNWQQLTFTQNHFRVRFEQRYRIEQRWTSGGFRNRFRFRAAATIPLNKKRVDPGVFYAAVWDEIFLTNRPPYFERNRFFLGAGYQVSKLLTLQAGWLNQFDYRITDSRERSFLQISLQLDFRREAAHDKTPGYRP